ncbi:hypothetical protein SKAU_G00174000 [Synaphobranchus kaupii]|uniref:Uncharacterized protein n=1 Tax=Synaphobranchus kaupii TaxID=118154 RepID=A0A9Q1FLI7_SYNKA|nr:hypothetical protein SKAU_G00174000 [Synaphobranchus kaupii]
MFKSSRGATGYSPYLRVALSNVVGVAIHLVISMARSCPMSSPGRPRSADKKSRTLWIGEGRLQGGLQLADPPPPPPPSPHNLPVCHLHQSLHLYPDCGGVCGLTGADDCMGYTVMLSAKTRCSSLCVRVVEP